MIIESRENKIIKYAKKLQDKKFANKEGKTLIESPKIIKELISLGFVDTVFISDESYKNDLNVGNLIQITDNIAKFLSQTETSTGVFAIANIPKSTKSIGNRVLILDNIQDPTNFGAMCRSAKAFGFDTIIDINCCFAYSSKVARCSMGNNFKLNIIKCSYQEVQEIKDRENIHIICLDMNGKSLKNARPNYKKFAIIIGNEGNGVSEDLRKLSDETIAIPMSKDVESLNASVTAGIIMYTIANENKD